MLLPLTPVVISQEQIGVSVKRALVGDNITMTIVVEIEKSELWSLEKSGVWSLLIKLSHRVWLVDDEGGGCDRSRCSWPLCCSAYLCILLLDTHSVGQGFQGGRNMGIHITSWEG